MNKNKTFSSHLTSPSAETYFVAHLHSSSDLKFEDIGYLDGCMAVVIFHFHNGFSFFFFPDIHLALSLSSKWRGVTPHPSVTNFKEAVPQLLKPGIWSAPHDGTLEWLTLLAWDSPSTQFSVGRRPENLETESENLEPEKVFQIVPNTSLLQSSEWCLRVGTY